MKKKSQVLPFFLSAANTCQQYKGWVLARALSRAHGEVETRAEVTPHQLAWWAWALLAPIHIQSRWSGAGDSDSDTPTHGGGGTVQVLHRPFPIAFVIDFDSDSTSRSIN